MGFFDRLFGAPGDREARPAEQVPPARRLSEDQQWHARRARIETYAAAIEVAGHFELNRTRSLTSPTKDAQWSMLEQRANDAFNRYMNGQIDMGGYEQEMQSLRGQGLDQIIQELTDAHAQAKTG